MTRSLALGIAAAAALTVGGCSQNGSYRMSWSFYVTPDTSGPTQSAAVGCGQHGVDSVLATGSDQTGDAVQITGLCTPGWFTSTAPDGTWTFEVQALDAQGAVIQSMMPTQTTSAQPIATDGPQAEFSVILVPLPACSDTVDNNRNGAVDTADPGCNGNPNGTSE